MSLKIAIGGDHAGFDLKKSLVERLESQGHKVKDFGPFSDDSVDNREYIGYPLFAQGRYRKYR